MAKDLHVFHGSPTKIKGPLTPRVDPRTGEKGVFLTTSRESAHAYALLANRARSNIDHTTKGGRFISGHVETEGAVLPKGHIYEFLLSEEGLDRKSSKRGFGTEHTRIARVPVTPSGSFEVTREMAEGLGWTFAKKLAAFKNGPHTKTLPGTNSEKKLDVYKLWEIVKGRKPVSTPLSEMDVPGRNRLTGFSEKRYEKADTSFPVIIGKNKDTAAYSPKPMILDGRHRVLKTIDRGDKSVMAVRVTAKEMESAVIKKATADLKVLSAFPSGSRELVEQYGLMSRKAILENPEVLKAVVASRAGTQHAWKNEADFIREVKRKLKDKFWSSSYEGPSVFFGPPDPAKIGPQHPMNVLKTQTLKINLTKLLKKEPKTVIHGSELVPYDPNGPKYQGEKRHHPITAEEARAYIKTKPEVLWKHYSDPKGRRYAGGVPHAHIVTPSGIIPREFLEF